MRKAMVLTLSTALLLGACGNESSKNEKSNEVTNLEQTTTEAAPGESNEIKDNKQYYEQLKKYSDTISLIATEADEYWEKYDTYLHKDIVERFKTDSERFKKAQVEFENSTNNLNVPKETELEDLLNKIASTYADVYEEHYKNLSVGLNNSAYELPSLAAFDFIAAAHLSVLEELTLELENYGKERLDAILTEQTANEINETVYTSSEDVDNAFKEIAKASLALKSNTIPADSADKVITPGFTFKLYEQGGLNDSTKEITVQEYNDLALKYNKVVHPVLTIGEITSPTTMTINNNLITRWNALNEVYMENNVEY